MRTTKKEHSERMHGPSPSPLRKLTLAIILAVLVFAVFWNTLSNGFVFDDTSMIKNNPAIRSLQYVKSYFTRPFFSVGQPMRGPVAYDYYRPMVLVSYLADHSLWDLTPKGYHLTNIYLHTAAVLLFFFLLLRMRLEAGAAFTASALFAVHPALADSIAGVSGRSDPLCAVFLLAGIYSYVAARQEDSPKAERFLFFSYAAFLLALLTKENAIALAVVITVYEFIRPDGTARPGLRAKIKPLLPIYLISASYLLWRARIVPANVSIPMDRAELALRLLTAIKVAVSYIYTMLFPHGLFFETFTPMADSFAAPREIIASVILIFLLGFALMRQRRAPRASFFILWFLAFLLPYSFFFLFHPEPDFFTPPHFLYFPSMGLAVLCGLALERLIRASFPKWAERGRWAAWAAVFLVILLFSAQTVRRGTLWHDDFTFFSKMVQRAPNSPRIHIGMANAFLNSGLRGSALAEYARAYELSRSRPEEESTPEERFSRQSGGRPVGTLVIANYYAAAALEGMGDAYFQMMETSNTIESYKMAIRENAFNAMIHFKLARAFESVGSFDEAIESYERALRLDRGLTEAASSLQITQMKKEVYDQANRVYLTALLSGQQGSADALYGEAVMLRLSGKEDAARALLSEVIRKAPLHFGANLTLGQIRFEDGEFGEALGNFSAAFAASPSSALAAHEVAITNLVLGDLPEAEIWAEKAYELAPDLYEQFLKDVRSREASGEG